MTEKGPHLRPRRNEAEVASTVHEIAARWGLTPKQQEVLARLVEGARNKAIAADLGCAEVTVEFHVTAILRKAGADSRSAVVAKFWSSLSADSSR